MSTDSSAPTPFQTWIARAGELGAAGRFEVGIPMRDGAELAADVYLPAGPGGAAGTDGDAAAPAIVQVTPYGKDSESLVSDEALMYQSHGYVFVAVDVRGRGKSEGEWVAFVNDAADTHDVIEWVAAQPWCDGQVGTTGLSYMGWVQWAGASQRPPHLRAMISTSAAGRWQQEIPYTNGVFQLYFAWWAYSVRRRILDFHGLAHADWDQILRTLPFAAIGDIIGAAGETWQTLCRRDTLDAYWKALRYDDRYGQFDVPCLHVTGWYDLEDLLGAFHHYEHMAAESPAAASQYLLVGPWSHVKSRHPDAECGGERFGAAAAHDMNAEHLRWFGHWLKGQDNGLEQVDRVRVFEPGRNAWRGAGRWPLSDTVTPLYLGLGRPGLGLGRPGLGLGRPGLGPGTLAASPAGGEASDEFRYDPADPVLTGLDVQRYPFEDVPLDQTGNEARDDVLCYTGEPLAGEVTISGWPTLELYASSDGEDTDWHVKITDVRPDGRSVRVTQGCLRAACRESLEEPKPLVPGEVCRFDVELWPTHHVFLPGHRIRVTVTSSDFPWFARSLNRFGLASQQGEPRVARNTVWHGGRHASRLLLPTGSGAAAAR